MVRGTRYASFLGFMVIISGLVTSVARGQEAPAGFKDAAILSAVMSGKVHKEVVLNTAKEEKLYLRAYFNKVSPQAYAELATNYEKYADMFEEIQEGKTTKSNPERTVFEYYMDIVFVYGLLPFHVYPEGRHVVTFGADSTAESTIKHELTNYKDTFDLAKETTRLVPYENGMLVEDEIHVLLKKAGSTSESVKVELVKEFSKFMETFRQVLKGDLIN
jgi:hypothetical protein